MSRNSLAIMLALGAVLSWSTAATAFALTLRQLSVAMTLFLAALTAALFFTGVVFSRADLRRAIHPSSFAPSLLRGLLNPFLYYVILFHAYERLPAQEAQPLNYTWPLMIVLLAAVFRGESLTRAHMLGLGVSFLGVLTISTRGDLLGFHVSDPLGAGLAVGSSVVWASYWILNVSDARPAAVKLMTNFWVGAVLTGAYLLWTGDRVLTAGGFAGGVYIGLFEMGIPFLLWMMAMTWTSHTARIGNLVFLSPFLSLFFVHRFVGEDILPSSFWGLTLIVAGIAIQRALGGRGARAAAMVLVAIGIAGAPGIVSAAERDEGVTKRDEDSFVASFQRAPDRMKSWDQNEQATIELLQRYMPEGWLAPSSYGPIDFYEDYLPRCVLRDADAGRRVVADTVTRGDLVRVQNTAHYYLDYTLPQYEAIAEPKRGMASPVYGRIYEDTIALPGGSTQTLLFLKYSFVFPYSGLPREIAGWKRFVGAMIGDPNAWHELDIHGAVHVVLSAHDRKPVGVLLAQHNHHRVFLAGDDFAWPANDRVPIGFAQFSNEPYLLLPEDTVRREPAAGNPMEMEWIFGRSKRAPLMGGYDVVYGVRGGAVHIPLRLVLLPLDDPLYVATISLGDRPKIWGVYETWFQAGPPGINYYTLPALKNLGDLFLFWRAAPRDDHYFRLVAKHVRGWDDYDLAPILEYQRGRWFQR